MPADVFARITHDHIKLSARGLRTLYPDQEMARVTGPNILHLSDLFIRTKESGQLIRFVPNPIQEAYLDRIHPTWRTDPTGIRGLREIDLKGRQFGLTTLWCGLFFLETVQTPYTSAVIIGQDAPSTEKIFQMIHRFYRNLPDDRRPHTKYDNKRELYFDEIDSSIYVGQAGSMSFGRGVTVNHLLATEIPQWPNATKLMTGIQESVPYNGNLILESTAEGFGDFFQQEWKKAYVNHDSIYTPRFFCWLDFPDYRISPEKYKAEDLTVPEAARSYLEDGPNEEERKFVEKHGADPEQMAWRRWKKQTLKDKFVQEYPTTPNEAFQHSGQRYFDNGYLGELLLLLQDSPEHQPLALEYGDIPDFYKLLRKWRESLLVWQMPRRDRFYVIAADPAEGLTDGGEHDYSSAHVLDTVDWEECAHFHARLDTHKFGLLLAQLGWWYGEGLLCVERNNHGHAVLDAAMNVANYPLMDETKRGGLYMHEDFDQTKRQHVKRPGWPTNTKTKYLALDTLKEAIEERTLKLHSWETVDEMTTFAKLERGRAGAIKGTFDDRVTSLSLATAMLQIHPQALEHPVAGGAPRTGARSLEAVRVGQIGNAPPGVPRDIAIGAKRLPAAPEAR